MLADALTKLGTAEMLATLHGAMSKGILPAQQVSVQPMNSGKADSSTHDYDVQDYDNQGTSPAWRGASAVAPKKSVSFADETSTPIQGRSTQDDETPPQRRASSQHGCIKPLLVAAVLCSAIRPTQSIYQPWQKTGNMFPSLLPESSRVCPNLQLDFTDHPQCVVTDQRFRM